MCESNVYMEEDENLTMVMPDVAKLEFFGNKITCVGILGERIEVADAKILEANLIEHKIILGKL